MDKESQEGQVHLPSWPIGGTTVYLCMEEVYHHQGEIAIDSHDTVKDPCQPPIIPEPNYWSQSWKEEKYQTSMQCNEMIQTERTTEWSWKGQVLPPFALRIPRGLHLQIIAMEEEDYRMVVGLAQRKSSNILLQSFQSPSTTGWARRDAIGPRHQKQFDWLDQRKHCLRSINSERGAIDIHGWEEQQMAI